MRTMEQKTTKETERLNSLLKIYKEARDTEEVSFIIYKNGTAEQAAYMLGVNAKNHKFDLSDQQVMNFLKYEIAENKIV